MSKTKNIIFGYPDVPTIGDTFVSTVLFKHNPENIAQFNLTAAGAEISDIFRGIAQTEFVENPIYEQESLKMFGDKSKQNDNVHAAINMINKWGVDSNDYIPKVKIFPEDIAFGQEFTKSINKPIIVISPWPGGLFNPSRFSHALTRYLPVHYWQQIVDILNGNGFQVIYFGQSQNFIPLHNTIPILDMPFRKRFGILQKCVFHLATENGLHHMAVANGCKCICIVPTLGDSYGFRFSNVGYTDDMWIYEKKRVWNVTFSELQNIFPIIKENCD